MRYTLWFSAQCSHDIKGSQTQSVRYTVNWIHCKIENPEQIPRTPGFSQGTEIRNLFILTMAKNEQDVIHFLNWTDYDVPNTGPHSYKLNFRRFLATFARAYFNNSWIFLFLDIKIKTFHVLYFLHLYPYLTLSFQKGVTKVTLGNKTSKVILNIRSCYTNRNRTTEKC